MILILCKGLFKKFPNYSSGNITHFSPSPVAPLSVDVLQLQPTPIREGAPVTLKCDVRGSKPPATIVWYNNSVPIEQDSATSNVQVREREVGFKTGFLFSIRYVC